MIVLYFYRKKRYFNEKIIDKFLDNLAFLRIKNKNINKNINKIENILNIN